MNTYDVYGLGNALVDYEFPVTDQQLASLSVDKGLMTLVDQERQHILLESLHRTSHQRACGGSAANSMIAVSQLGGKSFYSCKVASDEAGSFYFDDLKKNKVDSSLSSVARESGLTGKCLVLITPDGERSMNSFLGITETLSKQDLVTDALVKSKYLYIEGYVVTSPTGRAAAVEAKKIAEENGVKTALTFSDPNMVEFFREGLGEMIGSGVDLLFCNEAEALKFSGESSVEEAIDSIAKWAKSFVITLGSKGALVSDNGSVSIVPGYPCQPIDTNGAGDLFAGSFLYALSNGMSYEKAAKLSNFASSLLVQQYGPRLGESAVAKLKEFKASL